MAGEERKQERSKSNLNVLEHGNYGCNKYFKSTLLDGGVSRKYGNRGLMENLTVFIDNKTHGGSIIIS
jgi:hypothetical protein